MKLEQQADFIIADHARKDCPAGSVSWKFIEASVKAGELKDAKLYPAGSSTHTPRAAGSGQPTRQSRTPFTAEDDRILADWVLEAECIGAPTKGNELFKRLEEKVWLTCRSLIPAMPLYMYRTEGIIRTIGILTNLGVTAGSNISPKDLGQILSTSCQQHLLPDLDLLLQGISLIKGPLYDLRYPMSAYSLPKGV